jgi:Uma2 family endonuclease
VYNLAMTQVARVNYDDVRDLPWDGLRREVMDGELFVSATPTDWHQIIVKNMGRLVDVHMLSFARGERPGRTFTAPMGLVLEPGDGVEPDFMYISRQRRALMVAKVNDITDPPEWVVEVLSPSTAKRDRTTKLEYYKRNGVLEYWLVDGDDQLITVFDFAAGTEQVFKLGDIIQVSSLPDFEIAVADVFDPLD